jgi:hypothetical protein
MNPKDDHDPIGGEMLQRFRRGILGDRPKTESGAKLSGDSGLVP